MRLLSARVPQLIDLAGEVSANNVPVPAAGCKGRGDYRDMLAAYF